MIPANPGQRAIANFRDGPLMVNAGPGTGKTFCISARFNHIVQDGLAPPQAILAVTFTRDAARVMRERVQKALGLDSDGDGLLISTIHSLGYRILRAAGRRPRVIPPEDALEMFQRACTEVGVPMHLWGVIPLYRAITTLKERGISPEDGIPTGSLNQEVLIAAYRRYQTLLKEENLYDFGDLVMEALQCLRTNPDLRGFLQGIVRYSMVDEFQDTSPVQYELVRMLARDNLMVVGSPAQTIHEWRGASWNEIKKLFRSCYPGAPEITLNENLRSDAYIVRAASAVGYGYPDADQVPRKPAQEKVRLIFPSDPFQEAEWIACTLQDWHADGMPWSSMAVLYRLHAQAGAIERGLFTAGIPFSVERDTYARREVQALLDYLELALEPDQSPRLQRVLNFPPRGIAPKWVGSLDISMPGLQSAVRGDGDLPLRVRESIAQFLEIVDALQKISTIFPPPEVVRRAVEITGLGQWLQDQLDGYSSAMAIQQVVLEASQFSTLEEFLAYARTRVGRALSGGVTLSTIHASKGREWPCVIVAGVVEDILPLQGNVEEEKRVFYVAITRAIDRLVISSPRQIAHGQRMVQAEPSRFLRLIPEEVVA